MDDISITNQSGNLNVLGERIFLQALSGSTRELAVVFSNLISDLYSRIDELQKELIKLQE